MDFEKVYDVTYRSSLNSPSKTLKLINGAKRGLVLKWWPIPRNFHTPKNRWYKMTGVIFILLKNWYKGTRIIHKEKYIIFFQQYKSNQKQYCYAQLRTCVYYIASDAFFLLASHAVVFRFYTILSLEESWDFRNGFAQKVWCSSINMKRLPVTCKWNQISNERLCTGPAFKERLEAIPKWPNCLYNQTTRELRGAIIHTFT